MSHLKLTSLLVGLLVLLSLIVVAKFDQFLRQKFQPRQSATGLLAYLTIILLFIFIYTFLVTFTISHLFPVAIK